MHKSRLTNLYFVCAHNNNNLHDHHLYNNEHLQFCDSRYTPKLEKSRGSLDQQIRRLFRTINLEQRPRVDYPRVIVNIAKRVNREPYLCAPKPPKYLRKTITWGRRARACHISRFNGITTRLARARAGYSRKLPALFRHEKLPTAARW